MSISTFFRLLADMLFQWNHLTQFDKFSSWPRPTGQTDGGSTVDRLLTGSVDSYPVVKNMKGFGF